LTKSNLPFVVAPRPAKPAAPVISHEEYVLRETKGLRELELYIQTLTKYRRARERELFDYLRAQCVPAKPAGKPRLLKPKKPSSS
jgi:hypothetical protein